MRTTTATAVLLLLLAAFCACGGSGSSGFDVTAFAENAVIANAIETGQCEDSGALRICPAGPTAMGTPGPQQTPGPGETPGDGQDVVLDLPGNHEVACNIATDARSCGFVLTFRADGFPSESTYRIAVRHAAPVGDWVLGDAVSASDGAGFIVPVSVPTEGDSIQIAVLVFTNGDAPAPGTFSTLGETGASFAFVTDVVEVAAQP